MTPKKPRPQQSFREWAADPGRVVVRGEVLSLLRMERRWHAEQRWHRRAFRWLRAQRAKVW